MRDEIIQKSLAGVLEIGDEILFIGNENVKDSNIMHINELIANKDKIMLTIMPYVNYQKCLWVLVKNNPIRILFKVE